MLVHRTRPLLLSTLATACKPYYRRIYFWLITLYDSKLLIFWFNYIQIGLRWASTYTLVYKLVIPEWTNKKCFSTMAAVRKLHTYIPFFSNIFIFSHFTCVYLCLAILYCAYDVCFGNIRFMLTLYRCRVCVHMLVLLLLLLLCDARLVRVYLLYMCIYTYSRLTNTLSCNPNQIMSNKFIW